jgi:two-component system, cell cycle sensor histidine kinase DivJ
VRRYFPPKPAFIAEWIDALTHDDVPREPQEAARRRTFILSRFSVAAAVLLSAPAWLVAYGAPDAAQTMIFLLAQAPLLAVVALKRRGDLRLAQFVSAGGWLGLAAVFGALGEATAPLSAAFAFLALFEAASAADARFVTQTGAAAVAALIVAAGLQLTLFPANAPNGLALATPLLLYAALLSLGALRAQAARAANDAGQAQDLRLLTETIGDLALRLDRSGGVLATLGEARRADGLDARDLLGRGLFQRVHVADRPAFLKLVSDAFSRGEQASAPIRVQIGATPAASGRYLEPVFNWFEARVRPAAASAAQAEHAVCALRDIAAEKHAEDEIAAAKAQQELANAGKTRFLANVSHELRTPLNAIIGFSEMLGNPDLEPREPEKRREYADIIAGSGHHLLEVVNSILDMSKIESGSMQLVPEPFSMPRLIDSCCDMMQLKAEQQGVTIARDYPAEIEEIIADKRACKQILINLLSNAVKFTPASGKVTVRLRPEGASLAISVIDSGVGIAAADLSRLGEPFFQASAAHDRAYEGTGLGLSVVRGLVGLHGGAILVESGPKLGAAFTVRLPLDCRALGERATPQAKIETIARHGALSHGADLGAEREETVKKIA